VDDLKHAIYEACLANVGADHLPAEWLDGDLDGMQVQFLDAEDELCSLDDCHDLAAVDAVKSLHVSHEPKDSGLMLTAASLEEAAPSSGGAPARGAGDSGSMVGSTILSMDD